MGVADFLEDLVTLHPGRALERIPGGHFAETTAGKTAWDFINALTNAPGGMVYAATQAPRHPIRYLEDTAEDVWETWKHPLRHPGYTILNTIGLVPLPIGVAARGLAISHAATRGGLGVGVEATRAGTKAKLAQAVEQGIIPKELVSLEEASRHGRTGEFNRIIDPESGLFVPKGKQVKNAILFGNARQERLLWPKGIEAMDDPAEMARHGWWYSRDPTIRAAQKLVDRAYAASPDSGIAPIWKVMTEGIGKKEGGGSVIPGPFRTQMQRISSAEKAWQVGMKKEAKGKAPGLLAKWSHMIEPVSLMAMRLDGEVTPPLELIAMHQKMLDSGTIKSQRMIDETQNRIEIIREAAPLLEPVTFTTPTSGRQFTVWKLKPEHTELREFVDDFKGLSDERTSASRMAGVLNEKSEYSRAAAPFVMVETGEVLPNIAFLKKRLGQWENMRSRDADAAKLRKQIEAYEGGQLSFDEMLQLDGENLVGSYFKDDTELKEFVEGAGAFRIPYALPKFGFGYFSKEARVARTTYKGSRKPNIPGSYTNPFTGAILKMGGGEQNVARLIAESYTEAHRFIALRQIWDRVQQQARLNQTPHGIPEKDRQLVRIDQPGSKLSLSQVERSMFKNPIGTKDSIMAGRLFEGIRSFMFPGKDATPKELDLSPEDHAKLMGHNQEFADAAPFGYGWVDRRMLGDLYKKNPLIGLYDNAIATKAIRGVDAINQAMKSAMLFLRPAYAFPNMLGNVALNMIQEGMLAPVHMAMNARLWLALDKQRKEGVLVQMGESSTESRYLQGQLAGGKATKFIQSKSEWLAGKYSRVVDRPFRANAWIHEARRQGYETPTQINKLLDDPNLQSQRQAITNAATDEIINFERMGPGEEAFLRRLIFFYPFTRGASRYTINFPKEHPLATGAVGVLGDQGFERSEEILGPLPVWAEGIIPLEGLGIPGLGSGKGLVANPASFSIMGEPAHLAAQTLNVFGPHKNPDYSLTTNLPPVEQALMSIITAGQSNRFAAPDEQILKIAEQELFGGLPIVGLINKLRGRSSVGGPLEMSVYPDDVLWHHLSGFFALGGLTPREVNSDLMNWRRYQEQPATYKEHG